MDKVRPESQSEHTPVTCRRPGRALASFLAFIEDGGRERVQDIGPLRQDRELMAVFRDFAVAGPSSNGFENGFWPHQVALGRLTDL
jgi:hypothetical protein